ncbi:MAG: hypothetical protein HJJLKODD_01609 [Phycisphaerae bacterium]|nr:hypothetical protein [Phycisphaerae bacterium]
MNSNTPPSSAVTPPRHIPLLLLGIALLCAVGLHLGRVQGWWEVRYTSDGIIYIDVARQFAAGMGLHTSIVNWDYPGDLAPMVHYAPVYPILLGTISKLAGLSVNQLIWPISVMLYWLTLWLLSWLVWRVSQRLCPTLTTLLLIAASKPIFTIHLQPLSEPLYLLLLLASLHLLLNLQNSGRWRWVIGLGICTGLAAATRYQGIFLIPGIALLVMIADTGSWRRCCGRALLVGGLAALPIAGWMIRNRLIYPDGAVRVMGHYGLDLATLKQLLATWVTWISYRDWHTLLQLAMLSVYLLLVLWLFLPRRASLLGTNWRFWVISIGMLSAMQMLFLLVARAWFDPGIPFDDRIFSSTYPLVISLFIMALCSAPRVCRRPRQVALINMLLGLILISSQLSQNYRYLRSRLDPARPGVDQLFATLTEPLLSRPELHDLHYPLYSNEPVRLHWFLNRPTRELPHTQPEILDALVERLCREQGAIIYFDLEEKWRPELINLEALRSHPRLQFQPLGPQVVLITPTPTATQTVTDQ